MILKVKYLPNYDASWARLGFAKPFDSGMDLRAAIAEKVVLKAKERLVIPNGIVCEMQDDCRPNASGHCNNKSHKQSQNGCVEKL